MKAFTTGEVADFVGTDEWRIRRLFEDGTLPEPDRFGGKRANVVCAPDEVLNVNTLLGMLCQPRTSDQGFFTELKNVGAG